MAEQLYLVSLVGLFFLPYFLIEFSASQTERRGRTTGWYLLRGGAALVAFVSAGTLVLAPDLLFQGINLANGTVYPLWGPLFAPLINLPLFTAFGLAVIGLQSGLSSSPTERTERVQLYMLGGLALYVAYTASYNLLLFSNLTLSLGLSFERVLYVLIFAFLSALVLAVGWKNLRRWGKGDGHGQRQARWLALAFLVPFASAILVRGVRALGAVGFNLVGVFRLAGVGVITYGFARRRLYDLPQRVRRTGATATGSASALAAGGTAFGFASVLSGGLALPILAGVAATGATAMPALTWARRLFSAGEEDNPVDEAEDLYEQKIETYRAALEDAMARDTIEEDEPFLTGLRERFGISDEEDRILRYYARKSTVPRREGDPDTAYERLRILGEGGAGRTWLARDRSRDRLAVVKEPLEKWHSEPSVLEAARREARLAAKVRHPNVVEVEEVLEDEGRPLLVMEHVTGGSLADKLRQRGTLEPRQALKLGYDLAQGLQAIHEAGIVHRDLTPDNVLLTEDGRARITDFGLARTQDSSGTQLLDDEAGTKGYQAPEAAHGSDDPTVDVYGLAAIMHTCLYGSPPVQGTIQVETEVPRELQEAIDRGLQPDPDERYPNAATFADRLETLVER
jgi:tRNA A-37 threonylcarbamoyl transferase component Bud32